MLKSSVLTCAMIVLGAVSLPCVSYAAQPIPLFVEVDSGGPSVVLTRVLDQPMVDGVMLTIDWSVVEPLDNQYLWGVIDAAIDEAKARHKKVGFHFFQSFRYPAPQWLKAKGAKTVITQARAKDGPALEDIVPWDPVLAEEWANFLKDLSDHLTQKATIGTVAFVTEGADRGGAKIRSCQSGYLDTEKSNVAAYTQVSIKNVKALLASFPEAQVMVMAPPPHVCLNDELGIKYFSDVLLGLGDDASKVMIFAGDFDAEGSQRLESIQGVIGKQKIAAKPIWAEETDKRNYLKGSMADIICGPVASYSVAYFQPFIQDVGSDNITITDALEGFRSGDITKLCRDNRTSKSGVKAHSGERSGAVVK